MLWAIASCKSAAPWHAPFQYVSSWHPQIEGGAPVEFRAAVPTGPTHRFRFLVFGDMGESEHREAKSPG